MTFKRAVLTVATFYNVLKVVFSTELRIHYSGHKFNATFDTRAYCGDACSSPTVRIDGVSLSQSNPSKGEFEGYWHPQNEFVRIESTAAISVTSHASPIVLELFYTGAVSKTLVFEYEVIAFTLTGAVELRLGREQFILECHLRRQRLQPISFKWHFAYPTAAALLDADWIEVDLVTAAHQRQSGFVSYNALSVVGNSTSSTLALVQVGSVSAPVSAQEPSAAYAGHYRCSAVLTNGPADPVHKDTQIVSIPSTTVLPHEKPLYWDNDTATLTCLVFGNPVPDIFWYKKADKSGDAAQLDESKGKYNIVTVPRRSSLTIRELGMPDRAIYECTSQNSLGTSSSEVLLRVRSVFFLYYPAIGILLELLVLTVCIAWTKASPVRDSSTDLAVGEDERLATRNTSKKSPKASERISAKRQSSVPQITRKNTAEVLPGVMEVAHKNNPLPASICRWLVHLANKKSSSAYSAPYLGRSQTLR